VRGKPLTLNGRTQCIKHWALEFNIPVNTLRTRLERGDDLRTALTAARQGTGCQGPKGAYGVWCVWRAWITAPLPDGLPEPVMLPLR
jgi:hypothetical protein